MNAAEGMRAKCARCHRLFTVRKEGQIYGPTCARKEAASMAAIERYGKTAQAAIL